MSRQGALENGIKFINQPPFHQVVFLERLQSFPALPPSHIGHLGDLYALSTSTNAELRFRFLQLALLDPSTPESKAIARTAADWVVGNDGSGVVKGRMKFCRPVLRDASKADPEHTKAIFSQNKMSFHPIARRLIEKVSPEAKINTRAGMAY